jgi:hypothetical protein
MTKKRENGRRQISMHYNGHGGYLHQLDWRRAQKQTVMGAMLPSKIAKTKTDKH